MRRVNAAENVRVDDIRINRFGSTAQQAMLDYLASWLFVESASLARVADTKSAYIGDSFLASHSSGNREAGMVFQLAAGLGFRNEEGSEADANNPAIKPVVSLAAITLTALDPSDISNNRRDRIYVKVQSATTDNVSRDFVDPVTENISSATTDETQYWEVVTAIAKGVEDGSEASPTAPGGFTDDDAVAEVYVRAGSGTFDPNDLTDMRKHLVANPGSLLASMIGYTNNSETDVEGALDDLFSRVSITFTGNAASGYMTLTVPGGTNWAFAWMDISTVANNNTYTLPVTYSSATAYSVVLTGSDGGASRIDVVRNTASQIKTLTSGTTALAYVWTIGTL